MKLEIGVLFVLAAGIAAFACAAGSEVAPPPPGETFGEDAGASDGAIAPGTDASFGDAVVVSTNGCSSDLQSIVDKDGNVIAACPPDQGCFQGACIAACDAAAKSHGNVGCDFVVSTPKFDDGEGAPCFAVFVANAWGKAVKVTATYDGKALDPTLFARIPDGTASAAAWPAVPATGIPVNQVAVMFMSGDPNAQNGGQPLTCPVPQAVAGGTSAPNTTSRTKAFHIRTDIPVSAYDILPYGGAASFLPGAQMLLPTSAWGKNYVAAMPRLSNAGGGPQWAEIVAAEDDTTVTIVPTVPLPSGIGVPGAPAGAVTQYTLAANEVLHFEPCFVPCQGSVNFPFLEMSGSVIQSDKPIAFLGGTEQLCAASATSPQAGGCDSEHESIPPVSALGSEYVAAPYATRRADLEEESIPYRIVGAVDGTTLTFEPALDPDAGAPPTLKLGQLVDFEVKGAFVVASQDADHPFYLAQTMPGGSGLARPGITTPLGSAAPGLGDEELVNVLPPAQFLQKYVFFTDPTYGTTNLVVTRVKTAKGFADVTIDCLGPIGGFRPVGASGRFEITNVDLRRVADVGTCKSGQHVAKSDAPFGLTVWGVDNYASYAYPAGGNVAAINHVTVPPVPR